MKINRQEVYDKCNGHCAYCGNFISIKQMQVDHIIPLFRNDTEEQVNKFGRNKGTNDINNLNPSCRRCNKWKSTFSLEDFRNVIQTSINRLQRDTPNFNLEKDYNLININDAKVIFYFEKM